MILPQTFKAFVLVFTYCFLSFGIILSLGGIKFSNIEVEIAGSFRGAYNFSYAIYLALFQFIILFSLNHLTNFFDDYEISLDHQPAKTSLFTKIFSILYALVEYLIVAVGIILSFYDYFSGTFTTKFFTKLFSKDFNYDYPIVESLFNSFLIASIVSLIVIFVAYVLLSNYTKFLDRFIFSNMGISAAFLGVSLYYLNVIYDMSMPTLLLIGYIIANVPLAYSFMYHSIVNFPQTINDLTLLDTNNKFIRFYSIKWKLLKNIFISSYLQIFAIVFGEFTIAYTMQIEDIFPLAPIINYNLLAEKLYLESSAFSVLILFAIFFFFVLGEKIKNK